MKSFSLNIPISKVDEEQRIVYGYATKEELDRQGDIVDYEASKKAFGAWPGNIREQHDGKKAVGKKVSMEFNDSEKSVLIGAYLSRSTDGENALTKVKEGILTGFSIGGKIFKTVKETIKGVDGDESANRITDYELSELSLVDVPACPSAQFVMVKSADGEVKEVEEMHEGLEKTQPEVVIPITHKANYPWFMKHYAYASEQVNQKPLSSDNKNMSKESKEQTMSDDKTVQKATAVYGGVARDENAQPVKPDVEGKQPAESKPPKFKEEEVPLALPPVPNTTVELESPTPPKASQEATSDNAVAIPPTPNTETEVTPGKKKTVDSEMKKGLYTVSQLADCVSNLTWIVSDTEWEAQYEGEKSAAVAELKTAVTSVANALVSLTQEAVADLEMSNNPTDLMKMVSDNMKSTQDEMLKAFKSEMAGIVTASMKPLEDRLSKIESQPAGNAPVRAFTVVDKVADKDEPDELTQLMSKQADFVANPNKYGTTERSKLMTDIMVAKSRQRPVTVN